MRGRGGDQSDYGKWWVTDEQYCRQWSKWGKGQEACKNVYKVGELVHWFTSDGRMDDLGVIEADNPDNL